MKVLFAASECTPCVKTGGLADVIGSLPHALRKKGADVRVILPKYKQIPEEIKNRMTTIYTGTVDVGWRNQYFGVQLLQEDGVDHYFIDNEYYFGRDGLYGYGDEAERFVFFCRAVAESLKSIGYCPDIVHCHDWQTGLIPMLLKTRHAGDPFFSRMRTVFTIHNLKYQGNFPREILQDLLGIGDERFTPDGLEFYGGGSCLKAGIVFSHWVTTVSKTYAHEIQTPEHGERLDGILRKRRDSLSGIVNGIDTVAFDPASDPHLYTNYRSSLRKKRKNKLMLQQKLELPVQPHVPMIGMVSRLVEQKGLDLIQAVLEELMALDLQLVVLGTGDAAYEELFHHASSRYPEKCKYIARFDDPLARNIYAASDLFLMPSLFEPCGIGQLLAMRYLCVPIVRETGGLKDTVTPYNELSGEGNGFSFSNYNAHDMLYTIQRAIDSYHNRETWRRIIGSIKNTGVGWDQSAEQYIELYGRLSEL